MRKTISKKLVILLIEDTESVAKYKASILEKINEISSDCLICLILYGKRLQYTKIVNMIRNRNISFHNNSDDGNCLLYKAIMRLNEVVEEAQKLVDVNIERYNITSIEIIGIGRCIDKGSVILEDIAKQVFSTIISQPNVKARYFCIEDKYIVNAANLGFRSIQSLSEKY